ncbi:hypothetical protein B0H67DRAFT_377444 [Lasiosphaeris hirsuta]|uniref:Uncharacterized protein n=1 Tax=Lasiosphaeris hirsuta TaxID=260670 RepID=A0AA39ZX38_9PEZI|nr:hypothetical protein B0H67DRAFT_377444 [Lasiosphaeris hirsuta]
MGLDGFKKSSLRNGDSTVRNFLFASQCVAPTWGGPVGSLGRLVRAPWAAGTVRNSPFAVRWHRAQTGHRKGGCAGVGLPQLVELAVPPSGSHQALVRACSLPNLAIDGRLTQVTSFGPRSPLVPWGAFVSFPAGLAHLPPKEKRKEIHSGPPNVSGRVDRYQRTANGLLLLGYCSFSGVFDKKQNALGVCLRQARKHKLISTGLFFKFFFIFFRLSLPSSPCRFIRRATKCIHTNRTPQGTCKARIGFSMWMSGNF